MTQYRHRYHLDHVTLSFHLNIFAVMISNFKPNATKIDVKMFCAGTTHYDDIYLPCVLAKDRK